ncbi:MAG TPA: 4-(cytidine 5'-diphospho)-2-C-methyl-D-erythritol kinase [Urbifossiella sp.]|nr:4-(cytidine 5'-diphospho)-2-C-methyl-D-erythritol kinase [Urbifossiella sp.]
MVAPLTHGRTPCIFASSDKLVLAAPAKLNLFLEILGKRPDGYHDLATLMVAVNLFDTLEFARRSDSVVALEWEAADLPPAAQNFVYLAACELRAVANRPDLGADIRLTKRIPLQAGLGGGSSDAAAAILGLNELWNLNLSADQLAAIAARIGSDVAFFLALPAAWCTGRGEIVAPETPGTSFHIVLICPPAGLSTAAVYQGVRIPLNPVDGSAARAAFRAGDPDALGAALVNRLQAAAFHLAPVVETVYRRLVGLNPAGCLMSGSGSAVFALCRDAHEAERVAAAVRATRPTNQPESRVMVVRTL